MQASEWKGAILRHLLSYLNFNKRQFDPFGTPGMGINFWGENPPWENPRYSRSLG